jgi:hypothetical protein
MSFWLTHTTYHTYQERCPIQVDGWLSTQLWWTQMPSCRTNNPCLSQLHYSKIICMDASNKQIGSVIQQSRLPLAFYSHKLANARTHYTVIELELLAIFKTLQEYRTILLGHIVKIYMDHKNLTVANFNTECVHCWQLIVEEWTRNCLPSWSAQHCCQFPKPSSHLYGLYQWDSLHWWNLSYWW